MKTDLKPKKYYKDIHSINYDLLLKENKRHLLFDLDNTIAETKDKYPNEKVVSLFDLLHKKGFKTAILSNALPSRVKRFSRVLDSDVYYLSRKPNSKNYKKYMLKNKIDSKSIAAIGDQIYTDIKGANRLNISSILVDRISKNESIFTKPNRLKEKYFIYKKGIIKRGDYYE